MMNEAIFLARHENMFYWFRSEPELWVLDLNAWAAEFVRAGHNVPNNLADDRFGIEVVDRSNAAQFLKHMSSFSLPRSELEDQFFSRYCDGVSWWQMQDLFPVMFVDFDRRRAAAFYSAGIPFERYVPNGWLGEFKDFSLEDTPESLPVEQKFWVRNGVDYLKKMQAR